MTPLDIIIVNYNNPKDVVACLDSLRANPPARPHHIVVVDNGSTDNSAAIVREQFPDTTLIEMGRNAGFAAANNAGIKATTSPLVVLLNSDTLVPAGSLDKLCDRLEATGAAAAGPRIVDGKGLPEMSWGNMLTPLVEWRQAKLVRAAETGSDEAKAEVERRTSAERVVDWISGACLLARRDAAVAAGMLDERYFLYEEDVDFCAALRARGGKILFTPAAQITHLRGRTMRNEPSRSRAYYDQSHELFYRKHAPHWVPLLKLWKAITRRG